MDEKELQAQLATRFKELPKPVQDAILSSDVEGHLRKLAETHKLHLDQWALLENEVMLTLLGFERADDLAKNLAREVGIQEDVAEALAADISKIVFAPIHAALEQKLSTPTSETSAPHAPLSAPPAPQAITPAPAEPAPSYGVADTAAVVTVPEVAETTPAAPTAEKTAAAIVPATPPAPAPNAKVERAPLSGAYGNTISSKERSMIEGDPYREQVS